MTQYCINPLAPEGQCNTNEEVEIVVLDLIQCFEHLLPTFKKEIHTLVYDNRLETRSLKRQENFQASINSLSQKELTKLWYLYTRNKATLCDWEPAVDVDIRSQTTQSIISGKISESITSPDVEWLSLGGTNISHSPQLHIEINGTLRVAVKNFHKLATLKAALPIYEKSDKHKSTGYTDAAGDFVSPMTLSDKDAQGLLLVSVDEGKDRIGYYDTNRKYYRFKITRVNIYHGFEIQEQDINADTLERLRST